MTDIHTWLLCNWHIANNWHIFTHGSQWLLCPRRFSRLTTGDRNPLWLWYHVLLACCKYLWICVRIHVNICEYLLIYVNILKTNIWKISAMFLPNHLLIISIFITQYTLHVNSYRPTNKQLSSLQHLVVSSHNLIICESFLMLTTTTLSWEGQLQ